MRPEGNRGSFEDCSQENNREEQNWRRIKNKLITVYVITKNLAQE